MRKNKYSLIAVIILAVIAAYFIYTQNVGTIKKELKDFAVEDTNAVTKIFLADRDGNSVLLEKQEDNTWMVNNKFKARQDAISMLLKTMHKVEIKAPVAKSAFENTVALLSTKGIKVEIYTGGKKPSKVYYVGNATSDKFGTYMLLENSSVPFITHIPGFYGFLTPRYFTEEEDWRSTELFKYNINDLKSVEFINHEKPEDSFLITDIDTENPIVKSPVDGKVFNNIDTTKIVGYLQLYQSINIEFYLNNKVSKSEQDSVIKCCPKFDLTVTDLLGNKKTIKAYNKPLPEGTLDINGKPLKYDFDKMYAVINDGKDFVSIQYYVFDPLMQPITFFLKK
jgi:hypothetical protein